MIFHLFLLLVSQKAIKSGNHHVLRDLWGPAELESGLPGHAACSDIFFL